MEIKVLSCFHKKYVIPKNDVYLPIHVGKSNSTVDLDFIGDNTGDNISYKNPNYCELTALYWAWKNLDAEYIGLCHYRRYFNFNNDSIALLGENEIGLNYFQEYVDIDVDKKIKEIFNNGYDIILPKKKVLEISLYKDYCINHSKKDMDILIQVILEKYPDYKEAIDKIIYKNNKAHICNMFIMKKDELNKYCSWLFDILFEVEKRVAISEDPYQSRIFGFMSERLINIYVEKNRLKVKEMSLLFVGEKADYIDRNNIIKKFIRAEAGKIKRSIKFKLVKTT